MYVLNVVSLRIAQTQKNAQLVGVIATRNMKMGIKTLLPSEDDLPTSLVPCDTCGKGWPLESMIYLDTPAGMTAHLCCWQCAREFAEEQLTEEI